MNINDLAYSYPFNKIHLYFKFKSICQYQNEKVYKTKKLIHAFQIEKILQWKINRNLRLHDILDF